MSLATRIIPCLDVANGRVVKGINFIDLKDAGDPVEMAAIYAREGADEITFLDITASAENRGTTLEVLRRTAEQVFIPLTVGGGISSVEDVNQLLRAGADKISINTAAIRNPELISEIVDRFGTQVLVLSVDARRARTKSGFEVTTHGGRESAGLDALDWIESATSRGVGEILLNSMDRDGTRSGYDLEMIRRVREICDTPLIASGGAGDIQDFARALADGADALLAASVFHFGIYRISQIKDALKGAGYVVRESSKLGKN
ncbi:MAG: imidazole glycerol phosphate synthase subunit HisF [Actinomycetota bacterium]